MPHASLDMSDLRPAAREAALALSGAAPESLRATRLLAALDYGACDRRESRHRAALLNAAADFKRLFLLQPPDAPGAIAMGGEIDPAPTGLGPLPVVSVSGIGGSVREAFEKCVGEGIETMSIWSSPPAVLARRTMAEISIGAPEAYRRLWDDLAPYWRTPVTSPAGRSTDCVEARAIVDASPIWLPADLCWARTETARELDLPWPISTGCAAAPDKTMAAILGLLELIERDAAALWWCAGRPARPLPVDDPAAAETAALLMQLRGGVTGRTSRLLDITSDIGVPVIAAVSCASDGSAVCCGQSARPTRRAAARSAVLEMCQIELGARIAQIKHIEFGEAALCATDLGHLRRMAEINAAEHPSLRAEPPPSALPDMPRLDPAALLDLLCKSLARVGLTACVVELGRADIGVPVIRAACPGLQPAAKPPITARLSAAALQYGRPLHCWPSGLML